ncbi:ABC transporter permease [Halobaculum sp. MBLA0143]|uniref:ABC transporter permease n=1 Tax=Halobaculum sp. MBLA0143 TaxID=3079933 RepID=UPI003524A2A4
MTDATYAMVRVIFGKQLVLLKRYWINTVSNVATSYVMFLLLVFGGRAVAPTTLGESLAGLIVGFFLWSLSFSAFQGPANTISTEASWGTLEQLYASPHPFRRVVGVEVASSVLFGFLTSLLLLAAMTLTAGISLAFDPLTVVPLVVLTLLPVAGMGLAFGGLALVYKRISQVFLLVQFLLLVGIAARGSVLTWAIPLNLGSRLLTTAMSEGVGLAGLPPVALGVLVVKAVGFPLAGGVAFAVAVRAARRRGVMGHY